jgi:ATP-dependent DNA helicase RecG
MISEILNAVKREPSEKLESETLEFKNYASENALHNSKELAEEIAALANTHGGQIIIGVVDSSNIMQNRWLDQLKGFLTIDLDTAKERILGKIKPKIGIKVIEFPFEGKDYLVIQVPKVIHSVVTTSSGKIYIREGKSSIPASPEQVQALVKNLQSYDWSGEENGFPAQDVLNFDAVYHAKVDFCARRGIEMSSLSDANFLESIGATKNGLLNNSGLLFLGKRESIKNRLGLFEYRFSWKTADGELKINDVWDDCVWNSVIRAKGHFKNCNSRIILPYEGTDYVLTTLDEQAFHEAFLNAIVHRDYTVDGMTAVNFKENELVITNPGTFYGGVNSSNISFHEPRHRNKTLAKMLMAFQLVDRAGMGVLRIGLNSLTYGRDFPVWKENLENVEVKMPAEYFRAEIFLLTQKYIQKCSLTDLYILNSVYKVGYLNMLTLERELSKIVENPWASIKRSLERPEMMKYFVVNGNNDGIFICVNELGKVALSVGKMFKTPSNNDKHIKLFDFLKRHKAATNEELMECLNFSSPASTYNFLSKLKYVKNTGKSRSSRWSLK